MNIATTTENMPKDDPFFEYRDAMRDTMNRLTANGELVFTTNATGLFDIYLDCLPEGERQYHTCHCCRRFIEQYGGLVTIDDDGKTTPLFWHLEDAPELYRAGAAKMYRAVAKATVTGVFASKEKEWGQAETPGWSHLGFKPMYHLIHRDHLQTAYSYSAMKKEEFGIVMRTLAEFSLVQLNQAVAVLESDALYRSEAVMGPATWLRDLKAKIITLKGLHGNHFVRKAVAKAPSGFCHPRSSMIGTLLDDIAAGMDFAELKRRFDAKMAPLAYQRPKAAPTAGNVKRAEEIFEKMGLASALERRFATFEDVKDHAIWLPTAKAAPSGKGLFSDLLPKEEVEMTLPETQMTWAVFVQKVLPIATEITFKPNGVAGYGALVTAVHPDAGRLLQWDEEDHRNPVSWYLYSGGSSPSTWNVSGPTAVRGVVELPNMWGANKYEHQGQGIMLILGGAKDTRGGSSLALFPQCLRSELREVRSVIEAFSRRGRLHGAEQASACGLILQKGGKSTARLSVRSEDGLLRNIVIDRWE